MATQGLWNIGGFNLPDFGISEALGLGQQNAAITAPQSYTSFNTPPVNNQSALQTPTNYPPAGTKTTAPITSVPSTTLVKPGSQATSSGGLTADILRSKFGFNDDAVINGILNDPAQRARYEQELSGGNGATRSWDSGGGADLSSKNYSGINLGSASLSSSSGTNDIFGELYAAAQAGNQSAIDMINSQYGNNETELNRQLGLTDQYQGNDLNTLLSQFNSTNTDIGTQKTEANRTVETETGRAGDQARMTQKQNRNVLRALGILGSTYAAENLAAPINAFDKQKAEIAQWGTSRIQELDNFYNQKKSEYDNLVRDVTTKYGDLKQKIMADLRYNGQQKADALKAATAGAQQNLANLNMQKANYEQQIQQQKQALTTQIANMLITKTPKANMNDIMNTSIAYADRLSGTNPNQQVAVYQGEGARKKNSLTGV